MKFSIFFFPYCLPSYCPEIQSKIFTVLALCARHHCTVGEYNGEQGRNGPCLPRIYSLRVEDKHVLSVIRRETFTMETKKNSNKEMWII